MNRRTLLALTAALPFAAKAAWAGDAIAYSPDAVAAELAAGKTVVLDFAATWCSSCQAQGRSISALREENPAYADRLAFFVVDWDTYKNTDLAKQYGVTQRGSLVLLKGDQVVIKTDTHSTKADLKAMFDGVSA